MFFIPFIVLHVLNPFFFSPRHPTIFNCCIPAVKLLWLSPQCDLSEDWTEWSVTKSTVEEKIWNFSGLRKGLFIYHPRLHVTPACSLFPQKLRKTGQADK
jgi:hypothetical protein